MIKGVSKGGIRQGRDEGRHLRRDEGSNGVNQ